jgi:hypothetical protein
MEGQTHSWPLGPQLGDPPSGLGEVAAFAATPRARPISRASWFGGVIQGRGVFVKCATAASGGPIEE